MEERKKSMKYYNIILNTDSENIKANTKIRLNDYYFDSPIGAINSYMHRTRNSQRGFLAYRETNVVYALFSYNEETDTLDDAYSYIIEKLQDTFGIKNTTDEPYEITMLQAYEYMDEARRRDYANRRDYLADNVCDWLYYREKERVSFEFTEHIVTDKDKNNDMIYDSEFINELRNIEAHENEFGQTGNMVHYVLACRSTEAIKDMTETLTQRLYKANRLYSRRMEIITEITPTIYKSCCNLENIIENSYGGVIVFDLSVAFGYDSVAYENASKYILKLLKQYRNKCLFVFAYNMDHPGFAYSVLPEINKYVIPVCLREGIADRKNAVKYMKTLIQNSQYSQYANQANEFMKNYPGSEFTQTDVLMAYEQFEAWCVNKNILPAYNFDLQNEFMLERSENKESSYDKLQSLVGLDLVKKQIDGILAVDKIEKERKRYLGKNYQTNTMHMVFAGNPGTAKTTVAKLFGEIAKEKEILKSGALVERGGMDLVCVDKVRDAFKAAKGGVLFIDEAYSIFSGTVITALIQEMENHRDDVIVILAGYGDRMKHFISRNEGLKSRIPYWVDFPDYNADELTEIFKLMLKERGLYADESAISEAHFIFDKVKCVTDFGNGRYVRNLLEYAIQNQSVRLLSEYDDATQISKKAIVTLKKADIKMLDDGLKEERTPGTAKKEFDEMIGLSNAKDVIRKVIASCRFNKKCAEHGIKKDKASFHMVFTGNPGTAKTTVARLFAEILKDEKVFGTGNFVEAGRADLIGMFVGETALKVKAKFQEAQGGVLFIDEAYSLCDGYSKGYGDEAINTIVQEMENHRDEVIVVFAGYPEPMKEFLDRNPGMKSRIAFNVEFEDYNTDELCSITKLMLNRKQMKITDAASNKLLENYELARKNKDYGNGRYVRKIIEEAEMNLAQRLMGLDESELTEEVITTLDVHDIPLYKEAYSSEKKVLGFSA